MDQTHRVQCSSDPQGVKQVVKLFLWFNPRPGGGLSHLRHGGGGAK